MNIILKICMYFKLLINLLFYFSTNNTQLSTNQGSQNNQMQLQLDALKAMPYGDSPLFKRFYKVYKIVFINLLLYCYIIIISYI